MKIQIFKGNLRNKILSGFLLSLVLTLIVLITSYLNLRHLGKATAAILQRNYNSILAAQKMIDSIDQQNNSLLFYVTGNHTVGYGSFIRNQRDFEEWYSHATANITEKGEKETINNLGKAYTNYLLQTDKMRVATLGTQTKNVLFFQKQILPYSENVKIQCYRLRELNQATMFSLSDKARFISHRAIFSLWFIGLMSILIGVIFSIKVANQLMKPINLMLSATHEISEGHYDVQIPFSSEDEFGKLTAQFNEMTAKLKMFNDLNIKTIMQEKQKNDAIIQNIDDGIMLVDEEFRLININQKAAKVFRIDAITSLNKHFLEIINNQYLFNLLKATFETRKIPEFAENENILALESNGNKNYYQFLINPVFNSTNSWYGLLLLLRDVTKLKEIDQLKSEFVMIVSHELKTPLTSIGMSVDLLLESPIIREHQDQMELLTIAHEEILRLKALINDILDLSKMEAGKIELEFQSVDVATLIDNSFHIFERQADEKKIHLVKNVQEGIPNIRADINKINWVISNLVGNAIRYVKDGDKITLSAEKTGKFVTFSVADTGIGIPSEYQNKIFDKFVRIKNTLEGGGTGLGLAICKEIVRAHAGTIWLESEMDKGSNFQFTIPIYDSYTKM
jgi:two-component system, NtrC family, sensor histidine kinase KinB